MDAEQLKGHIEVAHRRKASEIQHLVFFLPYVRLRGPHSIAGVDFWPLRDAEGRVPMRLESVESSLSRILSSYIDRHGKPYDNCAVAAIADRGWDLKQTDGATVFWAASLLFLACWANNQYFPRFSGRYANSTSFRVVAQAYRGDAPVYVTVGARRRHGITWDGGYKHGDMHFHTPIQCPIRDSFDVDEAFLAALDAALAGGSAAIQRLRNALPMVQLANTDDDLLTENAEAILMASAFEQLLGAAGKKYRLAKTFGELFRSFGNETVASARRVRPDIEIDRSDTERATAQPTWWVHRKWLEELYSLRSTVAHEGDRGARKWGWRPDEHLVMAAFVFPLAVKLLLSGEGHYSLTSADVGHCKAIDKLLVTTAWGQERDGEGTGSIWHNIVEKAVQDENHERRILAFIEGKPGLFSDGDGGTVAR